MEIIDDRGYLFGLVNIIDALVVLLALAVVVAGVALVTGANTTGAEEVEQTTQVIVFQTNPYPAFVTEAIPKGSIQADTVVAVHEKSISDISTNQSKSQYNMTTARLRVELAVQTTPDGLPEVKGDRLYVGRELRLDFRTTIVDGLVIEIVT